MSCRQDMHAWEYSRSDASKQDEPGWERLDEYLLPNGRTVVYWRRPVSKKYRE